MKIFIDPGHGGHDSGAVGNGLVEKNLTLDISLKQKDLFEKLGHQVKISRNTDIFIPLSERVRQANIWGADLFISNHVNSGGGQGVEVWHSINGGKGKEYAAKVESVLSQLISSRGLKSKQGNNGDYLYVIRATSMPAILNEFGFIDNAGDAIKLKDNTFRQQLAEAVVKGITGQTTKENNYTNKYTINYCLEWQKFYNSATQTRAPLKIDGIYGPDTQKSFDSLQYYIIQSGKYRYCLEFQKWYNTTTKTRSPLKEDGLYGPSTERALQTITNIIKEF